MPLIRHAAPLLIFARHILLDSHADTPPCACIAADVAILSCHLPLISLD